MSFWSNPIKATKSFFGTKQPPRLQTQANNPIANRIKPVNFASIFDELSKEKFDIIKGQDGKMSMKFSNSSGRIDLSQPVQSRNINTNLPAINRINERASGVVALSQAMTRLANTIDEMEKTSPYLIEQNRELIDSFRSASTKALDRGFDFRQNAIDQKLTRLGLANSSSAFGVQVALAREKAYAYATMELKEAELAQGLKQQSIANLQQRGDLLGKNAQVELGKFSAESQNKLANQELIQKQAMNQKMLEFKNEEQRLATDFGNKNIEESRRNRMSQLGLNAFNTGNAQALNAQFVDNKAVAQQNKDQLDRFAQKNNPWEHEIGRKLLGDAIGFTIGNIF